MDTPIIVPLTLEEYDAAAAESDRIISMGCTCRLIPFPQRDALPCPWHRTYFGLVRQRREDLEAGQAHSGGSQ